MLVAAAGFKLYGQIVGLPADGLFFDYPRVQTATIELELILGLWVLSGRGWCMAWPLTLATFFAFAVVSGVRLASGRLTCGCLGRWDIHPGAMLAVDVTIGLILIAGRPRVWWAGINGGEFQQAARRGIGLAAGGMIAVACAVAAISVSGRSTARMVEFLFEDGIVVEPRVTTLADALPGERRSLSVTLRNTSDRDIRIVGGRSSCSCAVTEGLPVVVPASESRQIPVQIRLARVPGVYRQVIEFYMNDGSLAPARAAIETRVVALAQGAE
ncbi:MAG: hypothetical protein U0746_19845 [Gemmataceae bacterium]